jgi:hypothetical protein
LYCHFCHDGAFYKPSYPRHCRASIQYPDRYTNANLGSDRNTDANLGSNRNTNAYSGYANRNANPNRCTDGCTDGDAYIYQRSGDFASHSYPSGHTGAWANACANRYTNGHAAAACGSA